MFPGVTPARALRVARVRAGLSRRALAERAGTSAATIAAYESGRVQPSVPVLERILEAAGHELELDVVPRRRIDDAVAPDADLVDRAVALHQALRDARLPHAFGGELALARCRSGAPQATSIDIAVFDAPDAAGLVLGALPAGLGSSLDDLVQLASRGRLQLMWGTTPISLSLDGDDSAVRRTRVHRVADHELPFLSCTDLAIRHALAGRRQDVAEITRMVVAGGVDLDRVVGVVVRTCGADDPRVGRLLSIRA